MTHVKNGGKLYCQGHSKLIAVDAVFTADSFRKRPASQIVPTSNRFIKDVTKQKHELQNKYIIIIQNNNDDNNNN